MFRGSADHCGWPNSLIERHKSTVIPNGQCKEISIRDLLRPKQLVVVENFRISQADVVGPEAVMLCCLRHGKSLQDCGYGQRVRIPGARHDARRAVLGDRTRRPAMLEVGGEPTRGDGMSNVISIQKRDQNIDVEQRTHSIGVLFS